MTTKTKIYISFLYFWIRITYYFSKLITVMLYFCIKYIPDSFIIYKIPFIPFISHKTNEIKIVDATIYKQEDCCKKNNQTLEKDKKDTENNGIVKKKITNTIKLLINMYWDNSIELEDTDNTNSPGKKNYIKGGIDLDKLFDTFPEFKNSTIYITYYQKIQDFLIGYFPDDIQETFKTSIKHILIENISNVISKDDKEINIYKDNDLSKNYKNIFNELTF